MATSSELREHVTDLLWSQWREFGVAGTVARRHSEDCLDLESLIAFTAIHSDLDARLRDESIDWVLRYGSYVSRARLKNVLSGWNQLENGLFLEYAATVNAHGRAAWPGGRAKALAFRPRARPLLPDLRARSLLSLRIRAMFGVGARAELIRALLARPRSAMTASELAEDTRYGKRNVLNELEPLRFAGVVKSFRAINADRYSLAMTDELGALLAPLPRRYTRWAQTFAAIHLILELVRHSGKRSDLLNAVNAFRLFDEHREVFSSAGMDPPVLPTGAAAWRPFLDWAVGQVKAVARD